MDAGTLSPAELPFGARVRAVFTKYDGSPHWEYDLVVLGVDEYGVWVGGAPGGRIARPGREFVSDAHWVCLYPHDGMWVATFNGPGGSFSARIYVDVTTQASWWHRPDGVLSVSAVDLDLDVVRRFSGELFVDDVDEFDEHRVALDYPDELVTAARDTTEWLYAQLDDHAEPFADVATAWLRVCDEHVHTDEHGRAVAGEATASGTAAGSPVGARPSRTATTEPATGATRDDRGDVDTAADADDRGQGEEDLLAVWDAQDAPLAPAVASTPGVDRTHEHPLTEADDRPAVEVDYDEPPAPVTLDADFVARYDDDADHGHDVSRDFDEANDIDTSPVDPVEVTGLLLTTETGRESPLWFDGRPIDPEEVEVSDDLADHLRDWADRWNRDFDPERGWDPRAGIADYEMLGRWLGRRLKDAVGGVAVTLQLAHLGRSSLTEVPSAEHRDRAVVVLDAESPGDLPVRGDVVTLGGVVGCFSATLNARLAAWAEDGGTDEAEAQHLRDLMGGELGPDYEVRAAR